MTDTIQANHLVGIIIKQYAHCSQLQPGTREQDQETYAGYGMLLGFIYSLRLTYPEDWDALLVVAGINPADFIEPLDKMALALEDESNG